MAERHPHIDMASEEQLVEVLKEKRPEMRQVYLELHRLVVSNLPDINYSTDIVDGGTSYGIRQYGYDGWGMAAVTAHTKWASLYLLHGSDLSDPEGILEGKGKRMRHVKIRSLEQLEERRNALQALVVQAASLHV